MEPPSEKKSDRRSGGRSSSKSQIVFDPSMDRVSYGTLWGTAAADPRSSEQNPNNTSGERESPPPGDHRMTDETKKISLLGFQDHDEALEDFYARLGDEFQSHVSTVRQPLINSRPP